MKQPCEYNSHKVLPTIRSVLTKVLMEEAGLNQTEVSEILGISQAAVSHYSSAKRGDESILERFPDIDRSIRELGTAIANDMSPEERQQSICDLCRGFRNRLIQEALGQLE